MRGAFGPLSFCVKKVSQNCVHALPSMYNRHMDRKISLRKTGRRWYERTVNVAALKPEGWAGYVGHDGEVHWVVHYSDERREWVIYQDDVEIFTTSTLRAAQAEIETYYEL